MLLLLFTFKLGLHFLNRGSDSVVVSRRRTGQSKVCLDFCGSLGLVFQREFV